MSQFQKVTKVCTLVYISYNGSNTGVHHSLQVSQYKSITHVALTVDTCQSSKMMLSEVNYLTFKYLLIAKAAHLLDIWYWLCFWSSWYDIVIKLVIIKICAFVVSFWFNYLCPKSRVTQGQGDVKGRLVRCVINEWPTIRDIEHQ